VITIDFNGEQVNLVTGINLILTGGAIWYAKEVFTKLATFIKGKISIGEGM
jgi:hypothetical protein